MSRLRTIVLVLVLTLAGSLAAASPAAAGPSHGWDRHCGNSGTTGAAWWNLRAYNTACSVARKTADRYVFKGDESPKDWNCSDEQTGDEVFRANCTRKKDGEHQHIRFKFGA